MKQAVLISIQPRWCKLIASGAKTVEIRKSRPKIATPFRCYVYQTKNGKVGTGLFTGEGEIMGRSVKNGSIIGEFVCDKIIPIRVFDNGSIQDWNHHELSDACIEYDDMADYIGRGNTGFGWHISELVIYDSPKGLSELKFWNRECTYGDLGLSIPQCENCHDCMVQRPPQSWCYVAE